MERGWQPDETVFRLMFKDPKYSGLVVDMRPIEVGEFLDIAEMSDINPQRMRAEDLPKMARLFGIIAEGIIEWNMLDRKGEPVPATLEGVRRQDLTLMMALAESWMSAVGDVPAPLEQPSPAGRPSAVASLPMEPLSGSQAS